MPGDDLNPQNYDSGYDEDIGSFDSQKGGGDGFLHGSVTDVSAGPATNWTDPNQVEPGFFGLVDVNGDGAITAAEV